MSPPPRRVPPCGTPVPLGPTFYPECRGRQGAKVAFFLAFLEPCILRSHLGRAQDTAVRVPDPPDLTPRGRRWNIVIMQDFEHPEEAEAFLNALLKAEEFLEKNPEESLAIVSKYSKIAPELLSEIMKKQNYEVVLNKKLFGYLHEEAEWAIENRFSSNTQIPDYDRFIDKSYLLRLKPEAVI